MANDERRRSGRRDALERVVSAARSEPAANSSCDFRVVCPNCGARLIDRGCKSRCPRCHFFTDCSDPW